MKRLTILLLAAAVAACGGGGGGRNIVDPPPPVLQVAGTWNGTAVIVGVEGGGCLAEFFRSSRGLPLEISWSITQSGTSLTVDVNLDGDDVGRMTGMIDFARQFRLEAPVTSEQEELECDGDLYELEGLEQVVSGIATPSAIEARWRSPARIRLDGVVQGEMALLIDVSLTR